MKNGPRVAQGSSKICQKMGSLALRRALSRPPLIRFARLRRSETVGFLMLTGSMLPPQQLSFAELHFKGFSLFGIPVHGWCDTMAELA